MKRTFHGRVVVGGHVQGEARVTKQGLNALAAFQKSVIAKKKRIICFDPNNKDLYGKDVTGKIVCLPRTIGSTTGGMILHTVCALGLAPTALLFSEKIDSLAAAGVVLADNWSDKKIIAVDGLGDEFLNYVQDDMIITVHEDGTIVTEMKRETELAWYRKLMPQS